MKLPYKENVIFKSPLKAEEIVQRLMLNLEPKKTFRMFDYFKKNVPEYEGKIIGNDFTIQRILINYRSSFNPIIYGNIIEEWNGSIIKIRMRVHKFVLWFSYIWFFVFIFFSIIDILISLFDLKTMFFIIMIVLIKTAFIYSFNYETKKSTKFLQDLFEAEIIQ